jgi:RHS repeat-associated protein
MLTAERAGWLVSFDYDGADRVTQTDQNGQTVSYVYDIPGRTRTITYPSGRVITEQSDLRQRLDEVNDEATTIADYIYDLGNRVISRHYNNGVSANYLYNANNWITDLDHSNDDLIMIAGLNHAFDKEGNKQYEDKLHDATNSEAYEYDDIYRLVEFKVGDLVGSTVPVPDTQTQYNLDALGNWDSKTTDDITEDRDHNAVNEITAITIDDGVPTAINHDNNGNLNEDETYTYAYDEENRLISITRKSDSQVVGQYQYDALSRRVIKWAEPVAGSSTETRYFYDDARVIEEQDASEATQATYVYGNYVDEVLTMDRGGQIYYYHQNALWSVVAITDFDDANVVERYAYDAYGFVSVTDGTGASVPSNAWDTPHSAIENPYLFTGRRLDEEAGLYYYRARYYDSGKGRFLQRDPKGYLDGMNLYQYVRNNPTNFKDPEGTKLIVRDLGFAGRNLNWQNNFRLVNVTFLRLLPKFQFKLPFVGQIRGIVWLQTVNVTWNCNIGRPRLACRNTFSYDEWFAQASQLTLSLFGHPLFGIYDFGRDFHANGYPAFCRCCTETRSMDSFEGIVFGVTPRKGTDTWWGMLAPPNAAPANWNAVPLGNRTGFGIPLGKGHNWGFTVRCWPTQCVRTAIWGTS